MPEEVWYALCFIAAVALAAYGVWAYDRWHQRRAWAQAHEETRALFLEQYGYDIGPLDPRERRPF